MCRRARAARSLLTSSTCDITPSIDPIRCDTACGERRPDGLASDSATLSNSDLRHAAIEPAGVARNLTRVPGRRSDHGRLGPSSRMTNWISSAPIAPASAISTDRARLHGRDHRVHVEHRHGFVMAPLSHSRNALVRRNGQATPTRICGVMPSGIARQLPATFLTNLRFCGRLSTNSEGRGPDS